MPILQFLNKTAKHNRIKTNKRLWGFFFIGPMMLGILVFSIGPVFFSLFMSLTKWDGITAPIFIGLQNFKDLFTDKQFYVELKNTLRFIIGVVPATMVISLILAVLLNSRIPNKTFFRVVYFLPTVTMPIAIAMVWRWLFNSEVGLVNLLTRPFGLNPMWMGDPDYIMTAIIIVAVWGGVGYSMVIFLAGLQGIPRTYYEAADIDGANSLNQFIRITVPLISPTIFFLSITSLINGFLAFDIIFSFSGGATAGGGPILDATRTMVFGIYQKGFTFMKMGYAAAQAAVLFVIILSVTAVQFILQKNLVFYE